MSIRTVALSGVTLAALLGALPVLGAEMMTKQTANPDHLIDVPDSAAPSGITAALPVGHTPSPVPGTPVSEYVNPSTGLKSAEVRSADGATIGSVSSVRMNKDGTPRKLTVSLNESIPEANKIGLDAKSVSYDEGSNVAVSWLTTSEVHSLAAAQR